MLPCHEVVEDVVGYRDPRFCSGVVAESLRMHDAGCRMHVGLIHVLLRFYWTSEADCGCRAHGSAARCISPLRPVRACPGCRQNAGTYTHTQLRSAVEPTLWCFAPLAGHKADAAALPCTLCNFCVIFLTLCVPWLHCGSGPAHTRSVSDQTLLETGL